MRLSTLFGAGPAAVFLFAAAPAERPLAVPHDAVVLVVAGWCAPCRGELAQREQIAAAAAPRVVRIAAIDDSPSTRAMVAAVPAWAVWHLTPGERLALADAVNARSAGLPYAFATDARGRRCADLAGGLDAARTRTLVARCPP